MTTASAAMFATKSLNGKIDSFKANRTISRLFQSGSGRFILKLRDKLKLITRFVEDFKSKFSSTVNYGKGGCSIANMDSKFILKFSFLKY